MFIQIEETPNPNVLKFIPGEDVSTNSNHQFDTVEAAQSSPLATRVFTTDHVTSVFLGKDFLSVTKDEQSDWSQIKPMVLGSIMDHFQSGEPVLRDDKITETETDIDGPDGETIAQIKQLLETRVRPAVAQDGGDIVFHGFDKGIVYLHLQGACAGCPSATMTLKMGIENLLRHYVPEVVEVRPVA